MKQIVEKSRYLALIGVIGLLIAVISAVLIAFSYFGKKD
jgi:hypothetical protein